jgi:DNA-binding transcriptional MerR regulator
VDERLAIFFRRHAPFRDIRARSALAIRGAWNYIAPQKPKGRLAFSGRTLNRNLLKEWTVPARSTGANRRCLLLFRFGLRKDIMMDKMHAADEAAHQKPTSELPAGFARIGEMAESFGVSLRTLRFYEDKGLIQPRRIGNARLYSHRDKVRLRLVLLGRRVGFSLREVKQMMDLYDPHGSNIRQMKVVLEKSERQLGRLEKQRVSIEEAIGDLKSLITTVRNQLEERQSARRYG